MKNRSCSCIEMCSQLFTDRDMVMDVFTGTHDNHQMKINDRETLLITRVTNWKLNLLKEVKI